MAIKIYRPPSGEIPAYNKDVENKENAIINSTSGPSQNRDFPIRPAYGFQGKVTTLWANYTEIQLKDNLPAFHRYTIAIKPESKGKKAAQVINLFLKESSLKDIVTDFRSTLLSRTNFECPGPKPISYRDEDEKEPRKDAKKYTVTLSYDKSLSVSDLNEYLSSKESSKVYLLKDEMVHALNIFVNYSSKTNPKSVTVGDGKVFDRGNAESNNLTRGLKAVRGFYASVRLATSRLLVNVNVTHAAFYQNGSLLTLAATYQGNDRRDKASLELFLKRLRVRPTHLKSSRIRTIFGFASNKDGNKLGHPPRVKGFAANSKQVEFWWDKEGEKKYISVYDYFLREYRMALKNWGEPVINVGNLENPTYLPLETCTVLPDQVAKTKLDRDQISKMIKFAVGGRGPDRNAGDIQLKGFKAVGLSSNNSSLVRSPCTILITVPGRILRAPGVSYRNKKTISLKKGGWSLMEVQFNESGDRKKWACVHIHMSGERAINNQPNGFKEQFQKELRNNGVAYSNPISLEEGAVEVRRYEDIEPIFRKAVGKGVFLLIFIFAQKASSAWYNYIKQLGDTKHGIATICVVGQHDFSPQYVANITMKFNLKMGGNNQFVHFNQPSLDFSETMIVGIDVTHPATGSSTEAPSIAGMVASVDASLGQWPAVIRRQAVKGQEMVSELDDMLKSRLKLWHKNNKRYPKNILVYRDGVSEGQFKKVLESELPLLRKACRDLYPASDQNRGLPKISVIIVVKRHHTRFYPTIEKDADEKSNPKMGTVVDRGVTEARNWDFFLQAHEAIQGTARPIHYFVAHNEIFQGMGPGQNAAQSLENVTHGLCYAYGRATRAVSVCTPAYYADRVCDRARCYPDITEIHKELKDCMFYI
ncbi:Piwi-domain-containing protein [Hypoxylon sp. NC0597]|nr:Piwi-domain-containing protein [Hypoxylon sp. NC0597]